MQQYLYMFLLLLFIGGLVFLRLNQANIRGRRGERRVASRLQSLPGEYHVFNDVYNIEVQGRSVSRVTEKVTENGDGVTEKLIEKGKFPMMHLWADLYMQCPSTTYK